MKTIYKICGILMISALVLTSCGGDDDNGPVPTVESKEYTYTFKIPLQALASELTSTQNSPQVFVLGDIIGVANAQNFLSAEFQRGSCSIEVQGLSAIGTDVKLSDFTIGIASRTSVKLGNCTPAATGTGEFKSDIKLSSDSYTNLVQNMFTDLISGTKKTSVWRSFVSNKTFTTDMSNKVYLNITISGIFKYNVYTAVPL